MEMSFAELLLLAGAGILLYRAFRPVQRRLERALLALLGGPKYKSGRPIIDITSHTRKDKS